ncbi:hypothetical protein [Bartonella schoenbuchensis]|nr:hypothetical protein [Bartonella schoenbuchensis]
MLWVMGTGFIRVVEECLGGEVERVVGDGERDECGTWCEEQAL